MTDSSVIFVTTGSETEAETIAKALVEERLVACVNLLPPVRSIYRWEGNVTDEREWLMVMKTTIERFPAVEKRVRALHSYQVPEVIALPITGGAERYLRWLRESISEPRS